MIKVLHQTKTSIVMTPQPTVVHSVVCSSHNKWKGGVHFDS